MNYQATEYDQKFDQAVKTIESESMFIHAVQQLEQLANAGHSHAALFLAKLYSQGFRVEKDTMKAQHWHKVAELSA